MLLTRHTKHILNNFHSWIEVFEVDGIMYLHSKFFVFCVLIVALDCQVSGTPNGGTCRVDSNCDSGNCCGVWPFLWCRECCKDSHCPSGSSCEFWHGKCIDAQPVGSSCRKNSNCASGHCCGFWPFKKRECQECCHNSHCHHNGTSTLKCIFDKCQWTRKRMLGYQTISSIRFNANFQFENHCSYHYFVIHVLLWTQRLG